MAYESAMRCLSATIDNYWPMLDNVSSRPNANAAPYTWHTLTMMAVRTV